MKKHLSKQIYTLLVSALMMALYMNFVVPDIGRPVSILGFFLCAGLLIYAFLWALTSWKLPRHSPALLSGMFTLAIIYLIAMRTINSLDWTDGVVVVIVVTLMIQLLIVQKNN